MALYGAGARRWTMTERGKQSMQRSASEFVIGPSRLHWDGDSLRIHIDEVGMPLPQRVRGEVRVWPQGLCNFVTALDDGGRHRWGPIGPVSRVEVNLDRPGMRWSGHGYFDANEGDEPIHRPFVEWDWSRSAMADGSTAVIYDVRQKSGRDRVVAQRFAADGSSTAFTPPPRQALPGTAWGIPRSMRSEAGPPARVLQTLENTPFYVRSVLDSSLLGERVTSFHETLRLPRVAAWPVRLMLPFRMPRRA